MSHVNQVINLKRLVLLSLAMLITACSSSDDNTPSTVLIINPLGPVLQDFVTGFTEGMDEVRSEEDARLLFRLRLRMLSPTRLTLWFVSARSRVQKPKRH